MIYKGKSYKEEDPFVKLFRRAISGSMIKVIA